MSGVATPLVLGVIPARGGSKGVPRKNLVSIGGVPLVVRAIQQAAGASRLTRTVVSTEDPEIAAIARAAGGDVPFARPMDLAQDDTRTLPVVQHAVEAVEEAEGRHYDIVVLLQPTCPMRTGADIDACVDLLREREAASVVSVADVVGNHPFRMKRLLDDDRLVSFIDQGFEDMRPRQELPRVHIRNGAVYVLRRELVDGGSLVGEPCYGYEMPIDRSVNIDGPLDLLLAEHLLSRRS